MFNKPCIVGHEQKTAKKSRTLWCEPKKGYTLWHGAKKSGTVGHKQKCLRARGYETFAKTSKIYTGGSGGHPRARTKRTFSRKHTCFTLFFAMLLEGGLGGGG